jgi:GDP-4-dehydro-6-deoxy-D-mannose reductase
LRTLITGARGFCARHLAGRLRGAGHLVMGVDLPTTEPVPDWLDQYTDADVTNMSQVREAIRSRQPKWVFHLAGRTRGADADVFRVNLDGTQHVLDAVGAEAPDAHVLLVGSAAEYGFVDPAELPVTETHSCRPVGAYAQSKHEAVRVGLEAARRSGLKIVVARPFNIVGAGVSEDLVVGALIARIKRALAPGGDGVVRVGQLDSGRDFVAVEDVVDAYLRMIEGGGWGEIFNVCSGEPRSIRDVAERLCAMADTPVRLAVDPALVRTGEISVIYGSGAKARERFGIRPRLTLQASLASAWRGH